MVAVIVVVVASAGAVFAAPAYSSDDSTQDPLAGILNFEPAFKDGPLFYVQTEGTAEWYYTTGTQTITNGATTLTRSVELWSAPDGRYRVKTSWLDGSGIVEEIAHDGRGNKLVFVSVRGLPGDALVMEGHKNFAITGVDHGSIVQHADPKLHNRVVKRTSVHRARGNMVYESGSVLEQRGDASVLAVELPVGVVVQAHDNHAAPVPGIEDRNGNGVPARASRQARSSHERISGTNSRVLFDFNNRRCIRAYNYRNPVTKFFTANAMVISDRSRGDTCRYGWVSVWAGGYIGSYDGFMNNVTGWCVDKMVAVRYSASSYVSYAGYFEVVGDPTRSRDSACSMHYAYDVFDDLQLTNAALVASVRG